METGRTRAWRRVTGWLVELCYPDVCAVCGKMCEGNSLLCGVCRRDVEELEEELGCAKCGGPVAYEHAPCPWCLGKGVYPFERIVRLALFEEPLRGLIHKMKYQRQWPLGEVLADRLLKEQRVTGLLAQADCIVAVPLHFWRQFSRGYNQSQVIAKRLGKRCGVPVVQPVVRIRYTQTQTRIRSQENKAENVRGAFAMMKKRLVEGKRVVVVDDVRTSGATIGEVGREILKAGATSVSAVVVGIADPRGRGFEKI